MKQRVADSKPSEEDRWINRVPADCPHGKEGLCWTLTPDKTVDHKDALELFSLVVAKSALHRTPRDFPYTWGYVVQSCGSCTHEAYLRHRAEFWYTFPDMRRKRLVEALARMDITGTDGKLNDADIETVLQIVQDCRLTLTDFWDLDNRPAAYGNGSYGLGYSVVIDGKPREWHWKLRQVRNRQNRLFDVLIIENDELIEG